MSLDDGPEQNIYFDGYHPNGRGNNIVFNMLKEELSTHE